MSSRTESLSVAPKDRNGNSGPSSDPFPWPILAKLCLAAEALEKTCSLIGQRLYDRVPCLGVQIYQLSEGDRINLVYAVGKAEAPKAFRKQSGVEIDLAAMELRCARKDGSKSTNPEPDGDEDLVYAIRTDGDLFGFLVLVEAAASPPVDEIESSLLALTAGFDVQRLRREVCSRREELKRLLEMGEALTSTLRLEDLFWKIYELVGQVMDNDAFYIAFYEEGSSELDMVFVMDNGERYPQDKAPFTGGISSQAIQLHRAVRINRTSEEISAAAQGSVQRFGNRERVSNSLLAAPIISRGRTIGVISSQSYRHNAYSEEDARFLSIIASQAGVAIENARLFEAQERYAQRLRLVNEISRRISGVLDEEVLLRRFVSTLQRRLGYPKVALFMRDVVEASTWQGIGRKSGRVALRTVSKLSPVATAAVAKRASVLERVDRSAPGDVGSGVSTRVELAIPLRSGQSVLGVLQIESHQMDSFPREEVSTLEALTQRFVGLIEKSRLHKRIKAERDKFHAILAHLEEGVAIVGADFRWQYTNRWLTERVGDLGDRRCHQALFGREEPCEGCPIPEHGTDFQSLGLELTCPDGPTYWITLIPFTDEDGRRRVLELCRDITAQKRSEQETLRLEKLKTALQLAGSIAHELNQPLTGITGYCSLLDEEMGPDEPWSATIKAIEQQAARLDSLIKRFQEITRLENQAYWGSSEIIDLGRSTEPPT